LKEAVSKNQTLSLHEKTLDVDHQESRQCTPYHEMALRL
jgi:hypothetical protein